MTASDVHVTFDIATVTYESKCSSIPCIVIQCHVSCKLLHALRYFVVQIINLSIFEMSLQSRMSHTLIRISAVSFFYFVHKAYLRLSISLSVCLSVCLSVSILTLLQLSFTLSLLISQFVHLSPLYYMYFPFVLPLPPSISFSLFSTRMQCIHTSDDHQTFSLLCAAHSTQILF